MTSSRELSLLALELIDCAPQVRESFGQEGIAGLADSLKSVGLQQPILVRALGDRFVVIDGERRYRAALVAGWETIQALVEEGPETDPDRIVRQLVANCQREDLTPIETARAIEIYLAETGCNASQAAARLGFSAAKVSKLLALLTLPAVVQDQVQAGALGVSTAYEIAKAKDPEQRDELIADAAQGGLRRDTAAKRSRASKAGRSAGGTRRSKGSPRRPRTTIQAAPGCSILVTGEKVDVGRILVALEAVCARLRAMEPDSDHPVAAVADSIRGAVSPDAAGSESGQAAGEV